MQATFFQYANYLSPKLCFLPLQVLNLPSSLSIRINSSQRNHSFLHDLYNQAGYTLRGHSAENGAVVFH